MAQTPRIEVKDLPPEVRGEARSTPPTSSGASGAEFRRPLAEVEREHILAVVAANDGNRLHAAADLGIGIATLYRRLKQYRAGSEERP